MRALFTVFAVFGWLLIEVDDSKIITMKKLILTFGFIGLIGHQAFAAENPNA